MKLLQALLVIGKFCFFMSVASERLNCCSSVGESVWFYFVTCVTNLLCIQKDPVSCKYVLLKKACTLCADLEIKPITRHWEGKEFAVDQTDSILCPLLLFKATGSLRTS